MWKYQNHLLTSVMTHHFGKTLMTNVIIISKMQWKVDVNNDDIKAVNASPTIRI